MQNYFKKKVVEIHKEITPENAEQLGYEWIQDTIYDVEAPEEAMQDIGGLIESGEYILGSSASSSTTFCGLYRKLNSGLVTD